MLLRPVAAVKAFPLSKTIPLVAWDGIDMWFWHSTLLNWVERQLVRLSSWLWTQKARRLREYQRHKK